MRALCERVERRSKGVSVKWKIVIGWVAAIVVIDQLTKIIVDHTMPLDKAREALNLMAARKVKGKLVLTVS